MEQVNIGGSRKVNGVGERKCESEGTLKVKEM